MDAHEKALRQSGIGSDAIQTAVRFAAIVQSVAVAIEAAGRGTPQAAQQSTSPAPFASPLPGQARGEPHIRELSSPSVPLHPNI